jgi:hypothetical protein
LPPLPLLLIILIIIITTTTLANRRKCGVNLRSDCTIYSSFCNTKSYSID